MKQKSLTVSKRNDPRTTRTIGQIDGAFVTLMQRRAYSGIRVSDITKKAGIGRATFYAHYLSKHELLRAQIRRIVAPKLREQPQAAYLFDCTTLFVHITHARFAFRSLMTGSSRIIAERIIQDCLEERVLSMLTRNEASVTESVAPRFVAASLVTLIVWWIENDLKSSPAEMQGVYETLVGGGLQAIRSSHS